MEEGKKNIEQEQAKPAALHSEAQSAEQEVSRPDVLNYDDICRMVPALAGKKRLVNVLMKFIGLDKVNALHTLAYKEVGPASPQRMLKELELGLDVENEETLAKMASEGAFITVSNHPLGALDGIALIALVGKHRPDFKVMVNMILNYISSMRPNFIAVDALASNDPKKRAVSVRGIAEALHYVRDGHVMGFFPAGAVSKFRWNLHIVDRQWQTSVMRIIQKAKVPVLPIYFHDRNTLFFNILGVIDWRLRTMRLPREVFSQRRGSNMRISVGQPISPEEIAAHSSPEELGAFLKEKTYALRGWKKRHSGTQSHSTNEE